MCLNIHRIYNKYSGKFLYVPCGHCSSCLQQKASRRASKIKAHCRDNKKHCYFITLTYDNEHIPFLSLDRLNGFADNYFNRSYDFFSHAPICRLKETGTEIYQAVPLCKKAFDYTSDIIFDKPEFDSLKFAKTLSNDDIPWRDLYGDLGGLRIGVLYKPDFVNFIKRLRINYERIYKKPNDFKYFVCGEYGPTTHRPHFHLLLWSDASHKQIVDTVVASWPFADKKRTSQYVEIARKPADYVSSYLNGSLSLPLFLRSKQLKMSCSHSKDFGVSDNSFQLSTILDRFYSPLKNGLPSRTVTYDFKFSAPVNGKMSVALLLPQYVRDRYVPNFVGRGRLSDDALFLLYRQCAEGLADVKKPVFDEVTYDPVVFDGLCAFIHNKYVKYWQPLGFFPMDFAFTCVDMLSAFRSYTLRGTHYDMLLCDEIDIFESYDNIIDYYSGSVSNLFLDDILLYDSRNEYVVDPNKFLRNIVSDNLQQEKFHKFDKSRKIKML